MIAIMNMNRREFLIGASAAFGGCVGGNIDLPRHRSDYRGVQIGVISYSYWWHSPDWKQEIAWGAKRTLESSVMAGLGTLELMGEDAEMFAGVKTYLPNNAEERARRWRERQEIPDSKWLELRDCYDRVGVKIHIVKFSEIGDDGTSDAENDYCCKVAKLLGAGAITREVPIVGKERRRKLDICRRCGEIADRNGVCIAFHNHRQIDINTYDSEILSYSPLLRINFDIGHYVAGNEDDPLDFVRKYRDRIYSIHVKDRTRFKNGAKNLQFGKGDTPLGPLFKLLIEEGLTNIPCDIEREYAIPAGSDAEKEVCVCNSYCHDLISKAFP